MNDRTRISISRTARIAAGSLLALSALGSSAAGTLAAHGGGSGAIWTTTDPCTSPAAQNVNLYAAGDTVYVRGDGFASSGAIGWTIAGLPGGASGDPGATVASGTGTTDPQGDFCIALYIVAADDWGEYTVDVTQDRAKKNDNYHVNASGSTGGTTDPGTTDPGSTETGSTETGGTNGSSTGDTSENSTGGSTGGSTGSGTTGGSTGSGTTGGSTGGTGPGTTGPGSTGGTTDSGTTPTQSVLGETDTNPTIELPATDTLGTTTGPVVPTILIAGLAAVAGLAVLFAPSRRRKADQLA